MRVFTTLALTVACLSVSSVFAQGGPPQPVPAIPEVEGAASTIATNTSTNGEASGSGPNLEQCKKCTDDLMCKLNDANKEIAALKQKLASKNARISELIKSQQQKDEIKGRLEKEKQDLESKLNRLQRQPKASNDSHVAYILMKMPTSPKSISVAEVPIYSNGENYQLIRVPVPGRNRQVEIKTAGHSTWIILEQGSHRVFDAGTNTFLANR